MADIGNGTTFTMSGFTAAIMGVTPPSRKRGAVDIGDISTTGARPFLPEGNYDGGDVKVRFQFDPTLDPPIDDDPTTVTITYPDGSTDSFSGFMTDYTPGEIQANRLMEGSATIKVAGPITTTAAT